MTAPATAAVSTTLCRLFHHTCAPIAARPSIPDRDPVRISAQSSGGIVAKYTSRPLTLPAVK